MIRIISSRIFWGAVLIIGGVLLLLNTFGIIQGSAIFWLAFSALVGILFIALYISDHDHWWALIPGVSLVGIAAAIGIGEFVTGFNTGGLIGSVILGSIALSFFLVYLVEHGNWWAIIPGGILATLAIVSGLSTGSSALAGGGIFFVGLGITFALVAVLPNTTGPMRWAWIPAAILAAIGILLLVSAGALINYVWPIILIIGGILLLIRAFRRRV